MSWWLSWRSVFEVDISQIGERKLDFYFEDAFCCEAPFTICSSEVAEGEDVRSSVDQRECKTIVALTCESEQGCPEETKDEDSLHSGSLSNLRPLRSGNQMQKSERKLK